MILGSLLAKVAAASATVGMVSIGVAAPADAADEFWGAIAVSKSTGNIGHGWDSSWVQADDYAKSYCRVSDCEVLIDDHTPWCIAVSQDSSGLWYTGRGTSETDARNSAMHMGKAPTVVRDSICP